MTAVGEFIHLHSYRALATIVGHALGFPIGLLSNFGLQIQVLFDSDGVLFWSINHGNLRVPPLCPPPGNKALLRDY